MSEVLTTIRLGARRCLPAALSGCCCSETGACTHEQQAVSISASCYLCLRACACLPAHAFRYPYTHDHARHNSNRLIHTNICIRARKHTHTHTHTLRYKRQTSHEDTSAKNPNTICALCHMHTYIYVQTKYAQKHTNIFKLADTYIIASMCVCVCVCACVSRHKQRQR